MLTLGPKPFLRGPRGYQSETHIPRLSDCHSASATTIQQIVLGLAESTSGILDAWQRTLAHRGLGLVPNYNFCRYIIIITYRKGVFGS